MPPGGFATFFATTNGKQDSTAIPSLIRTHSDTSSANITPMHRSGCLPDGRPHRVSWTYDRTELVVDGIVHCIGLSLALLGIATLIAPSGPLTDFKTASIVVYALGLAAMLGFSAAYSLWPVSPVKWLLRRCDQSAIFIFIAATYTPLIAHLKADVATLCMLAGVWIVAFFGVMLKALLPGRFDRFSIGLCLLLGCSGILLYQPALDALPSSTLYLVATGGALYATGIIFHLCENLRFQNSIWHVFVLAAAICHYAAIANCASTVV